MSDETRELLTLALLVGWLWVATRNIRRKH